jgi:uncharacterized protein YndB with AHSA1/START domain
MADRPRLLHGEFTIARVYDAPRELVWRTWTDPEHIAQWWGPTEITTPLDTIEVDLRPGGVFRTVMVSDDDGGRFPSEMTLREVVEPELLVFEWEAQRGLGAGSLAVTFTELGKRTRVTSQFSGWTTEQMLRGSELGWSQAMDKLAALLAAQGGNDL